MHGSSISSLAPQIFDDQVPLTIEDSIRCPALRIGLILVMTVGMRPYLLTSLLVLTLPLTACNFYFGGGDDPDPCDYGGSSSSSGADQLQEAQLLRDPQTGQCQDFGWTGPGPCDSECGPCDYPAAEPDSAQAFPSWGYCESYCTGLDQDSCLATDGCRGIFADGGLETGTFQECWQTDQGGAPSIESCEGLDAYACSQQDSCIAQHQFPCGGSGADPIPGGGAPAPTCGAEAFVACHNETGDQPVGCYGDQDCGEGFSCNAADICLPPPSDGDCDPSSGGCGVPAVCYGYCVADPVDPGECDGEVFCDSLPPLCEAGSTPGIKDGCWTGQCIDLSLCPQTECAEIAGESMCVARADCDAFYVGVDCSCDANGCTCASWDYDSCNNI